MLGRPREEESESEDEDSKEKDAKLANSGYKDSFGICDVHMKHIGLNYLNIDFFSGIHSAALVGVPEVQHVYLHLADSFIKAD